MMKRLPTLRSPLRASLIFALVLGGAGVATAGDFNVEGYHGKLLVTEHVVPAPTFKDPNLASPWGLARSETGPWWVANAGSGTATVYRGNGRVFPYVVLVPSSTTGIVHQEGEELLLPGEDDDTAGTPAEFLFASEEGFISAWNPSASGKRGPEAVVVVDRSAEGAVYQGLAISETEEGTHLYATDFNNGRVDVFDADFALVDEDGFVDEKIPDAYAPFGIRALDGMIFVTYARRDTGTLNAQHGGGGFVDAFDVHGEMLARVASDGSRAPYGLAIAPEGFGAHSGDLLVGQYDSGQILAYDRDTFAPRGVLRAPGGRPIVIEGLRAIDFGNGRGAGALNYLYFTAGSPFGRFGALVPTTAGIIVQ